MIGDMSFNTSPRPSFTNQSYESFCTWIRFGISILSSIFANVFLMHFSCLISFTKKITPIFYLDLSSWFCEIDFIVSISIFLKKAFLNFKFYSIFKLYCFLGLKSRFFLNLIPLLFKFFFVKLQCSRTEKWQ